MGQMPTVFAGDRSAAEGFVDALKAYFRLNHQFPAYASFLTRIALALTLIQGPLVEEWARYVGDWLDQLDPILDDVRDTWDQFLEQFLAQFVDSQRDQRARNQLENFKMQWPLIDQYIMDFQKLIRDARYRAGSAESIQMFIKGLPNNVAADVLKPPLVHTYEEIKHRAIESVTSIQLIASINRMKEKGSNPSRSQANWQNFGQRRNRPQQNQQQAATYQPRYNSSNAPRAYNNAQVPMDMSRARTNRQWQGAQANLARPEDMGQLPERRFKGECFNCGKTGHFKRDCRSAPRPNNQVRSAQMTDYYQPSNHEQVAEWPPMPPQTNPVESVAETLATLTVEQRNDLVERIGGGGESQDFQTA
jgi:hypothetical protein